MTDVNGTFVTDTNKTPLIQIVTWLVLASAVICTLCRAYTKWAVIKAMSYDDYFVPLSLIFIIAESVTVTIQTVNGYGKPTASLTEAQVTSILQAQYAVMMLYIPALVFSKLPSLVLLNMIKPANESRRLSFGIAVFILAWAFSSELVAAFQCVPTEVWDYRRGRCIDIVAFLTYFETMNAFTDLLLIIPAIYFIFRIQVSTYRKLPVLCVVCARFLPLAAILAKAILYHGYSKDSDDPLFAMWPVTIIMQIVLFLELLAACVTYIRPFLDALTSGFINADDLRRRGQVRSDALYDLGWYGRSVSSAERKQSASMEHTLSQNAGRTGGASQSISSTPEGARFGEDCSFDEENVTRRGHYEIGLPEAVKLEDDIHESMQKAFRDIPKFPNV